MKNHIHTVSALGLVSVALVLSACVGTPQQMAATGVYAIGEAVSARLITSHVPAATVLDISHKLALVPGGTLTPADYGTLSGEVDQVRSALKGAQLANDVPTEPSSSYAAIDAFLSGVASGNASASAGRAPTVNEGIALTVIVQFTNGLADGVAFATARNATLNPAPASTP